MRVKRMAVLAVMLATVALPAQALTIQFSQKAGDSLSGDQSAAFQLAAQAWSTIIKNDVTLSVQIGFAHLGDGILGSTSSSFRSGNAFDVENALRASAATALDRQADRFLPGLPSSSALTMTTAQAKALGLADPASSAVDGTIEFSSTFAFSTGRNAKGQIAAKTYDLVGIAEHEIGHLLGFVSGLDFTGPTETVLDLFRYSDIGKNSLNLGAKAYFSIDGGKTRLAPFADGVSDQASHWENKTRLPDGTPAVMDPEIGTGTVQNITALDIAAIDAIGWNAVAPEISAVPLPASEPLFGAALVAFGLLRRCTGNRKAA